VARWMDDDGARWPPHLAVFNPAEWPPAYDEVETTCTCASCTAKYGPPRPAQQTITAARRRWRKARLATLEKGTDEYLAEVLSALRENLPERHRP